MLHAPGKLSDQGIGPVDKPHERQFVVYPGVPGGLGLATEFEAQPNVVSHRAPWQQSELLEHHGDGGLADPAQGPGIRLGDAGHPVAGLDQNLAPHHRVQPIDRPQKR